MIPWFLIKVVHTLKKAKICTRGLAVDFIKLVRFTFKAEAYLEPSQTSKMELFMKTVNDFQLLTNYAKSFVLDVWLGSQYTSEKSYKPPY